MKKVRRGSRGKTGGHALRGLPLGWGGPADRRMGCRHPPRRPRLRETAQTAKEVGSAKSPASLPIISRLPSSAPPRRRLGIRNCIRHIGGGVTHDHDESTPKRSSPVCSRCPRSRKCGTPTNGNCPYAPDTRIAWGPTVERPPVTQRGSWCVSQQLRADERKGVGRPRFGKHQRVLPLPPAAPLPLSQNGPRNPEATMKPAVEPDPVEGTRIYLRGL
jgi:hypothetical protein